MNVFGKNVEMNNVAIKTYKKKHTSIIGRSSLFAGIGFLLTCLFGYAFSFIVIPNNAKIIIMIAAILISMGLSFYVSFKTTTVSYGVYALLYFSYCISSGLTFESIFSLFNGIGTNHNFEQLLLIFGIAGAILTFTGIIGTLIPNKVAMNLMKFVFILFGIYIFLSLCLMLFFFLSPGSLDPLMFGLSILSGLISILYIAFTFNSMSRTEMFINDSGEEVDKTAINKMCLFFGFILLSSIINLIIVIARLFIIIR